MKHKILQVSLCICAVIFFTSCGNTKRKECHKELVHHSDYPIEIYDFENFEKAFLEEKDDTLRVINFWATWCKPCVQELPFFEEINAEYPKVQVTLVSLDFPKHIESKLIPFLKKNNLKSRVVLLDDDNANKWINEVDEHWSGAIPATIFYKGNKRIFHEKSFTKDELVNIVNSF